MTQYKDAEARAEYLRLYNERRRREYQARRSAEIYQANKSELDAKKIPMLDSQIDGLTEGRQLDFLVQTAIFGSQPWPDQIHYENAVVSPVTDNHPTWPAGWSSDAACLKKLIDLLCSLEDIRITFLINYPDKPWEVHSSFGSSSGKTARANTLQTALCQCALKVCNSKDERFPFYWEEVCRYPTPNSTDSTTASITAESESRAV